MANKRKDNRGVSKQSDKRAKIIAEYDELVKCEKSSLARFEFQVQQKDKVEKKVDLIVKDAEANSLSSLSIWGSGFSVEKTIAVVEELKRTYTKQGKRYSQETSIKSGDNNEPHLQVILTLLGDT